MVIVLIQNSANSARPAVTCLEKNVTLFALVPGKQFTKSPSQFAFQGIIEVSSGHLLFEDQFHRNTGCKFLFSTEIRCFWKDLHLPSDEIVFRPHIQLATKISQEAARFFPPSLVSFLFSVGL